MIGRGASPNPGFLLGQDTYFVGTVKGVGKIYQQTVIDTNCSLAFAKLYLSKVPMAAVDVLNDRVLPFYDVEIEHILTACYGSFVKSEGKRFFGYRWESDEPIEVSTQAWA